MKLTKAQRKALLWIKEREPVSRFPVDSPSLMFVKKLRGMGLLEHAGTEPGMFGFVKYQLSEAGRRALQESE